MSTARVAQVAVVCCSVLLVGGYLYYAGSDSLESSSKQSHTTAGEGGTPTETQVFAAPSGETGKDIMPPGERAMIGSSKFAAVSVPTTQPKRRMIYGSKSGRVMEVDEDSLQFASAQKQGLVVPEGAATQPRTIIQSGWKSAPIKVPEPRTMMAGSKSNVLVDPAPAAPSTAEGAAPQHANGVLMIDLKPDSPATRPSTHPATQPATVPATRPDRRMFPGSKSFQVIPPAEQEHR